MPIFNWQNSAAEANAIVELWLALAARYDTATGAVGVDAWRDLVAQVRELETAE